MSAPGRRTLAARLPFYYGWLIIAVAFMTMGISVTARTAFSLLLDPLRAEYGWETGLVAGAFSFGFLVSAILGPLVGRMMDRHGPRIVIEVGVLLLAGGLFLAPIIEQPWQLYLTLGLLVGGGANLMSFTAQSLYLPNWFERRRAFAIGIAFSGVGVGAIILLPWLQGIIEHEGWRASCWAMGWLVVLIIAPLNLLVRLRPQDIGLLPDGAAQPASDAPVVAPRNIVDPDWVAVDWTLARAMRTFRFWWLMAGFFFAVFAWYAVQVHQTAYLVGVGFSPMVGAWALGVVSVVAIPGQIGLGALSDRFGREWIWMVGCSGFIICFAALLALGYQQSMPLLYLMVISQGLLGYALTSVMGPIVAEIFEGPHFGSIFGVMTVALIGGGAAGPWVVGLIRDLTGAYAAGFMVAIGGCVFSIVAIWIAAPRKVRLVPGRSRAEPRSETIELRG